MLNAPWHRGISTRGAAGLVPIIDKCERGSVFENAETVTSSNIAANKGSVASVHSAALDLENLLISR